MMLVVVADGISNIGAVVVESLHASIQDFTVLRSKWLKRKVKEEKVWKIKGGASKLRDSRHRSLTLKLDIV